MSLYDLLHEMEYARRLDEIRRKSLPIAAEVGARECQRSGVCCWTRPCDLHPGDDVARLAAFLGLTPERLFADHLVVDRDSRGLRLRPRRRPSSETR